MDRLRVIHLEDSPDDAFFVRRILEDNEIPADIILVPDRDGYLSALDTHSPDLILCDHGLPGFDSKAALNAARAKYPEVPFIVLSGLITDSQIDAGVEAGVSGFVQKNRLRQLVPIFRKLLSEIELNRKIHRLEEQNRAMQRLVEAANGELETFSYSVSHDLRSPLNTVNLYTQFLDKANGLSDEEKGYLARIRSETDRMSGMIADLRRLAKLTTGSLNVEEVNLSSLARKLAEQCRAQNPGRSIDIDIQENMFVQGDPELLEIMLEHLLSNAWKYTSGRDRAVIAFHEACEAGRREFLVRDNGAGFDMQFANKLFIPFQRLHPQRDFPGIGIGLATVQRIVRRHGGELWAKAEPGKGATFSFTIPEVQ